MTSIMFTGFDEFVEEYVKMHDQIDSKIFFDNNFYFFVDLIDEGMKTIADGYADQKVTHDKVWEQLTLDNFYHVIRMGEEVGLSWDDTVDLLGGDTGATLGYIKSIEVYDNPLKLEQEDGTNADEEDEDAYAEEHTVKTKAEVGIEKTLVFFQ